MEETKDSLVVGRVNQGRILPQWLLQLLMLFLFLCFTFPLASIYMIKHFGFQSLVPASVNPSLQPCKNEESINLEPWIKPPSKMLHTMSDKEVFWRASLASRIKEYPFKRVPTIAFMFLTKEQLPFAPLWERFFKGQKRLYSIYIHSLPPFRANYPPSSVFYKRQIPSQVAEWGEISITDAERRLLANALLDISNECFVSAFDDPGPHGRGRYNNNMEPEVNITQWRKGSQWFEVNRKLALYIVEDTKFYPKFAEFCKPACYADEHYFATMLTIQAANLLANRSITWVDWSRGGAHPAMFGKTDITEELMKRMLEGDTCSYNDRNTSMCCLFARKFAPGALEPLLLLAPKYLGF
ncbi:glycosyltransferase BC10-like isoform X2 [Nicotiana sylvestris]|uniref:glycosyltransferase BC10-like isoform X2 n=1 Tax=Nicotiana sylvestris TaxID=4096 RepID=UPI00388CC058